MHKEGAVHKTPSMWGVPFMLCDSPRTKGKKHQFSGD
jgi:hypothetical protein